MPNIYYLKCSVCGMVTGEWLLPKDSALDSLTMTLADAGFDDVRCDVHRV